MFRKIIYFLIVFVTLNLSGCGKNKKSSDDDSQQTPEKKLTDTQTLEQKQKECEAKDQKLFRWNSTTGVCESIGTEVQPTPAKVEDMVVVAQTGVSSSIKEFSVGNTYITKKSASYQQERFMIPVTNNASQTRCGVQAVIRHKYADGTSSIPLASEMGSAMSSTKTVTFPNGATGHESTGGKFCLQQGQTGFILGVLDSSYNTSEPIYVEAVLTSVFDYSSLSKVITSTLVESASGKVSFTLTNSSSDQVLINSPVRYVLFNSNSTPVYWGYLKNTVIKSLNSGDSVTLDDDISSIGDRGIVSGEVFVDTSTVLPVPPPFVVVP
ncbi:MAG: hypothetical protein HQK54_00020 [Oligoflexales bacterium]|nr:hypothetical protein [Oligoflexales bacterium]